MSPRNVSGTIVPPSWRHNRCDRSGLGTVALGQARWREATGTRGQGARQGSLWISRGTRSSSFWNEVGYPTMTRRVLFVVTTLGWGGAESQVIDLAKTLKLRGWEVAVVVLLVHAERSDPLSAAGIPVHTLGMARGIPDPRALWRLARLVRSLSPAVVHAHMVHSNLLSRVVRLIAAMPVLISSAHSENEGGRWRELAYRLTDRLTDLTTNVSHAAVKRTVSVGAAPEHRIRYMPNGVDLSRFRRDMGARAQTRARLGLDDRFTWLAVGRLEEPKDYPAMIEALAHVTQRSLRPQLLIVGDGPLRHEMEGRARSAKLEDSVRFLGLRRDVPALMNAADGYVMSSVLEGLPMVLLEAAATGLPIVATDVGGNAQIVRHGETGVLVPANDSRSLAEAMIRMMGLPADVRSRWGEAGAVHVRCTFGLDAVVDQWERLYTDLYNARDN